MLLEANLPNVEFVLLDEWDANLDENAIGDVDLKINKLAQMKCVIEIRHRRLSDSRNDKSCS